MLQGLGGDGFLQNRVRLDQENASEDPRTGKETKAVKPSQTWSEFAREYKVASTLIRGSRGKNMNMGSETSVGMPYTGQGVLIREYGGGERERGLEYANISPRGTRIEDEENSESRRLSKVSDMRIN
ncbi:hypothetical protein TEQG_07790 [Trichophyton equinum CBS 127.97]|uniref:Uncharacterized protein n=1 Tax=Trichophyton equinum (strain ATCC MYA-4606 / CBS 127.97) TaxID=559882 RepID=F2Q415_TRIEC|nr:hypothetical protein TEQG_07790 [Trichophyton equinum CBS 127.97]